MGESPRAHSIDKPLLLLLLAICNLLIELFKSLKLLRRMIFLHRNVFINFNLGVAIRN